MLSCGILMFMWSFGPYSKHLCLPGCFGLHVSNRLPASLDERKTSGEAPVKFRVYRTFNPLAQSQNSCRFRLCLQYMGLILRTCKTHGHGSRLERHCLRSHLGTLVAYSLTWQKSLRFGNLGKDFAFRKPTTQGNLCLGSRVAFPQKGQVSSKQGLAG